MIVSIDLGLKMRGKLPKNGQNGRTLAMNIWDPPSCEHSSLPYIMSSFLCLVSASRRETIRVSPLWSALTWLLSHDQAPADARRGCSLPVYCVHGVLQQPGCYAETCQEPRGAGLPPRLDHQQHLPVHLPHLSYLPKVLIEAALVWLFSFSVS